MTDQKPIDTIGFAIVAAKHGGLAIYETAEGDSPVFSGNLDEFTSYVRARAEKLETVVAEARKRAEDERVQALQSPVNPTMRPYEPPSTVFERTERRRPVALSPVATDYHAESDAS